MEVSAAQVKELREKTGVGMMQCKKALAECNGDMELAFDLLRKQGAAVAAKRADKAANEGSVFLKESDTKVIAIEVNCETDFVSGSADFKSLAQTAIEILESKNIADVNALKAASVGSLTFGDKLNELLAKIGENIGVKGFKVVQIENDEIAATYSHMGGKIGVVIKLKLQGKASDPAAIKALAKDLAMQIAAASPVSISQADIDPALIAKEREIYREQAIQQGTKEDFVDRVVDGRVTKYLKEVCLVEQVFVKDSKVVIKDLLKSTAVAQGLQGLEVTQFVRMELGK
jgi:elongation factor Ts